MVLTQNIPFEITAVRKKNVTRLKNNDRSTVITQNYNFDEVTKSNF